MGVDNTGKMGKGLVEALRELASGRGDGVKSGEGELRVMVDGGESREDGKTPRDELRNERNWRTWRTEGILGERLGLRYVRQKRRIEKVEENWGQLVR